MVFFKKYGVRLALMFICSRLLLTAIGVISQETFSPHYQKPPSHVFSSSMLLIPWGGWDTGYYMTIVKDGYMSPDGNTMQIGWFPLYPLAVKALSLFIPHVFVSGLLVSNFCLLLTIFVLGAWLSQWQGEEIAYHSVLFMLFFPTSMVLSGFFSESIFLLFLTLSFYFLYLKKRLAACISFSLLMISRPVAIAVVPFFIFLLCPRGEIHWKTWIKALFPLCLIPIPFIVYSLYLWGLTGDPLAYVHNKIMYHHHTLTNPFLEMTDSLRRGIQEHRFEHAFNTCMVICCTIFLLPNLKSMGVCYSLVGLVLIFFPLLTGAWLLSASRYLAVAFPVFSGLAIVGKKYAITELLFMGCLLIQGLVMLIWSIGGRFLA